MRRSTILLIGSARLFLKSCHSSVANLATLRVVSWMSLAPDANTLALCLPYLFGHALQLAIEPYRKSTPCCCRARYLYGCRHGSPTGKLSHGAYFTAFVSLSRSWPLGFFARDRLISRMSTSLNHQVCYKFLRQARSLEICRAKATACPLATAVKDNSAAAKHEEHSYALAMRIAQRFIYS